jgi:hypothetical protein
MELKKLMLIIMYRILRSISNLWLLGLDLKKPLPDINAIKDKANQCNAAAQHHYATTTKKVRMFKAEHSWC